MPAFGKMLQHARAMVFDFDGTLVDSNPIKRRAFAQCFGRFPQRRDILAYCWDHHHTPRGEKFRYVYEQILKRPYTPAVATALHRQFERATTRQIIAAPELPGTSAFLHHMVSRNMLMAVLSSTPQEILQQIVEARGWRQVLGVVQGAPVAKARWLKAFRKRYRLTPSQMVFVGDSHEDAEAAQAAECLFVGINQPAGTTAGHHVSHFMELLDAD